MSDRTYAGYINWPQLWARIVNWQQLGHVISRTAWLIMKTTCIFNDKLNQLTSFQTTAMYFRSFPINMRICISILFQRVYNDVIWPVKRVRNSCFQFTNLVLHITLEIRKITLIPSQIHTKKIAEWSAFLSTSYEIAGSISVTYKILNLY